MPGRWPLIQARLVIRTSSAYRNGIPWQEEVLLKMRIVLDAGHGPETAGKRTPDGTLREFQFNAPAAQYASDLLQQYEGVETMFVHAMDRDVPLAERTGSANRWGADLYLSIHANAAGNGEWNAARGVETFVYTTRPAPAVALANALQRQLVKATGLADRGVKSADFHVLRETHMAAVLVECGFMTHREEAELLKSDSYRRKCAQAIVAAIVECYGLKRKQAEPPLVDDISGHWAEVSLRKAIATQAITGFPDGSYQPDQPVTRAQLAMILDRLGLLK